VNPEHLFLGTHGDNARDRDAKGRTASGQRNGKYTKPERTARGMRNGAHTRPDRRPRGERSGSRLHPERLTRGEAQWKARLTEATVREMRRRVALGESQAAVARSLGVDSATVNHVIKRRTWRHVP
jgi:hypothetical protein